MTLKGGALRFYTSDKSDNDTERGALRFYTSDKSDNDTEKGSLRFYNLLTSLQTVPSTYAQVAMAQSRADHVQHIERLSHAT